MERAAIGFRVKTGWAAAILIGGSSSAPILRDVRTVPLADPAVPGSTQPYHAGLNLSKEDGARRVAPLVKVVERFGLQSVEGLLKEYARAWHITGIGVVVGSLLDPATLKNDHIRAHAEEGRLFYTVIVAAAETLGLKAAVISEGRLYEEASAQLHRSASSLKKDLTGLGRTIDGRWRSEEKGAALAAWMALA